MTINRTDLAIETPIEGLKQEIRGEYFKITEITIDSDTAGQPINKRKGRYVTLEIPDDIENRHLARELAAEIGKFIPNKGSIFVAGLGNKDITPDSLGPKTTAQILATRHLPMELRGNMRDISVLSAGVLAQTGIETAEIIRCISNEIKATAVIIIDALACGDISRLCKTIQITDSGISPGSGISNARKEVSRQTLGVPVIAIGIPTVVDINTIVRSVTGQRDIESLENMMVTPRDIDIVIEKHAELLAEGINYCLNAEIISPI